jgi:uncharacterized membrane protein
MATDIVIRTGLDRLRYAVLFELMLVVLLAVVIGLLFDRGILEMGVFTLALSFVALAVNFLYNLAFDRFDVRNGRIPTERTVGWRVMHAVGFETTLVIVELPLFMWWMNWGIWRALAVNIALMAGIVAYTYVFTLAYDKLFPIEQARRDAAPG